jgi:phage recombination protein Bet
MSKTTALVAQEKGVVRYTSGGQEISLTPDTVRRYLVSGRGSVDEQEVMMFMALCKANSLNPFLRDAYLIKYSEKQPAAMVVSKYAYAKRAERNPHYRGFTAGVVVIDHDGNMIYRPGAVVLPSEVLVGGWAEVVRDDRTVPVRCEVSLGEYIAMKPVYEGGQRTNKSEPNEMWKTKPATMIRKVALAHAWREAFPEDYAGLYSEEEMPEAPPQADARPAGKRVQAALTKAAAQVEPEPQVIDAEMNDKPSILLKAADRFGAKHIEDVSNALGGDDPETLEAALGKALTYAGDPPTPGSIEWEIYIDSLRAEEGSK